MYVDLWTGRYCFYTHSLKSTEIFTQIKPTIQLKVVFSGENTIGWRVSIQFNSKTLFKDGDPVSLQLIFPGAIQTYTTIVQTYIQYNTVWRCIWHCSVFQCIGLSRPDEALQHMMMAKELVPKFPAQVK